VTLRTGHLADVCKLPSGRTLAHVQEPAVTALTGTGREPGHPTARTRSGDPAEKDLDVTAHDTRATPVDTKPATREFTLLPQCTILTTSAGVTVPRHTSEDI
jgi:hypothetical protein